MIVAAGYIRVFRDSYERRMDAFNEIKLLLLMYHMMLFTDFVP